MGAKMKSEKNSLVLLSSKRTKADTRTRADEAFALPPFLEATRLSEMEESSLPCKEAAIERHSANDLQKLKQTMLQHEAMFREQVRELHRLYQVQRLLMAEKKRTDSAIRTSSGPPSSNSSLVYSSDSFKAGGERSLWEATGGSTFNFKRAHQDFASTPEQMPTLQGQFHVNMSPEAMFHPKEYIKSKHQKGFRPTFDLERPAEEYMDVEAEEEKSIEKETSLRVGFTSNVSQLSSTPFGQKISSGKDIQSRICPVSQMEAIDFVHRESKISDQNGTYDHFLFEHSSHNEAMVFPTGPSRMNCPSPEGLAHPTSLLSTKSLLGGLLGLNYESQFKDKSTSDLQRRGLHEIGERRRERHSIDAEAAERSIQENSKQPHWLLQGQAASMKTMPSNPLTQNNGWLQPTPFFLQKQDEHTSHKELGFFPGQNGRTIVFKDIPKGENESSGNGASLHQCQVLAFKSQGRLPSEFSLNGKTGQGSNRIPRQEGGPANGCIPVPLPSRDERGACLLPALNSSHPCASAVDMQVPVVDSHATPFMCLPGFSSRGTAQVSATQPSLQQNGLSSLMHQQQAAKLNAGSLPLACQSALFVPPHVDSVTPQGPTNSYEVQASNLINNLGGCVYGKLNTKVNVGDSTALSAPKFATPGVSLKKPVFESNTVPADVELTLGPSHNDVNQTLEFLTRDDDRSFLVQMTQEHSQNGTLSSMGDSFVTKARFGKSQPMQKKIVYSEACQSGDGNFEEIDKRSQQETGATKSTFSHEASCAKGPCSEELQMLQGGLKATAFAERDGKEIFLCDVDNVKPVLHLQTINECHRPCASKVFQGLKQGVNCHQRDSTNCTQSECDESGVVSSTGQFNCGSSRKRAALKHGGQVSLSGLDCLHRSGADRAFGLDFNGSLMTCKSSEILIAMGNEARVAAPQVRSTGQDKGITGSGEACQSHEPGIVCCQFESMVVALSSNMQSKKDAGTTREEAGMVVRHRELTISSGVVKSDNANDSVKAECEGNTDDRTAEDLRKPMDENFIHTCHAAEILLRLASDLEPMVEMGLTVDSATYTQERSLEWFANIIPRENNSAKILGDADAAGSIQLPETSEGERSVFEEVREDTSGKSEPPIDDVAKEVRYHKDIDSFESITLKLKTSGLDTDEVTSQDVGRWSIAGECQSNASHRGRPFRRGRAGRDFQREMLPSIASLSRQEITEDLQTIGGLMRSAAEMVAKRTAGCLSLKEAGYASPTRLGSTKNNGRTKGNYMDALTKSSRKDGMEDQNGFRGIYSWGESTRRRRMRRHRSRWSLLPLGVGICSP